MMWLWVLDSRHDCVLSAFQNLDDGSSGALNGGAPPGLDASAQEFKERADGHHGNDFDSSNHGAPAANISRGDSFVSPAMYV